MKEFGTGQDAQASRLPAEILVAASPQRSALQPSREWRPEYLAWASLFPLPLRARLQRVLPAKWGDMPEYQKPSRLDTGSLQNPPDSDTSTSMGPRFEPTPHW